MPSQYLKRVEKSQTLLLNEQSRQLEQAGQNVYKMGFGQSPFMPPELVVAKLKEYAGYKDYSPVQGIPELRNAIAAFHKHYDGLEFDPANILVAPGSKLLIYGVLACFTKADVLIPAPSWVSYVPQSHLTGHNVIKIQTHFESRWRITPELLAQAVSKKADTSVPSILILNYPGNPDGLSYSADELEALTEVARKHKILVISDEIYGLLNHTGSHRSIAHHYPENTVITGGLSKWCGAGGWRLGIAMLPKELSGAFKDTLLGVASETYSCASMPVQLAACTAYQPTQEIDDYLKHQRRVLAALGNECQKRLQAGGIKVCAPKGGFYLFLDFRALKDKGMTTSETLCEKLLADTGVVVLPGTAFGMDETHLSARLAYVDFDGKKALAASEALGFAKSIDDVFLKTHCDKMLKGIDKLSNWVEAKAAI